MRAYVMLSAIYFAIVGGLMVCAYILGDIHGRRSWRDVGLVYRTCGDSTVTLYPIGQIPPFQIRAEPMPSRFDSCTWVADTTEPIPLSSKFMRIRFADRNAGPMRVVVDFPVDTTKIRGPWHPPIAARFAEEGRHE